MQAGNWCQIHLVAALLQFSSQCALSPAVTLHCLASIEHGVESAKVSLKYSVTVLGPESDC